MNRRFAGLLRWSGYIASFLQNSSNMAIFVNIVVNLPLLAHRSSSWDVSLLLLLNPFFDLLDWDEVHPERLSCLLVWPDAVVERGAHSSCCRDIGEGDKGMSTDWIDIEAS